MTTAIGIVMTDHIVACRLEDHRIAAKPLRYPTDHAEPDALAALPPTELVHILATQVAFLAKADPRGIAAPVYIANDADAIAAGVAATHGRLEKLTRVWTIGNGIGYGRWPYVEGVWEGGHITVTLDPKERYCGCGGLGHLEGIMGYRAMRMRFLDLEPEEVFAHAKQGDQRCREFVDLWHRALAAATASFIHIAGPGRFYFTGQIGGVLQDRKSTRLKSRHRCIPYAA